MKKKRVVDVVGDILTPFLQTKGLELIDVEFVKEGPYRYLRVTIDRDTPITLDDCQVVSQYLNKRLDELDPIEEQYFLEVTSPGVERVLKKDKEFLKYSGSKVQLNLFQPYDGQKIIIVNLVGLIEDNIVVEHEVMGKIEIAKSKVSLVKLVVDFDEIEDIEDEEEVEL